MTRQYLILLVFLAVFGTVAPGSILGKETVYVQNYVTSSSHSGGYSSSGADGVDGQDGEAGKPGQAGKDVYSVSDGASIELHSVSQNGDSKTYVFSSTTGSGVVSHDSTSEEGIGDSVNISTAEESVTPTEEQRSQLISIINALQQIIKQYVNVLF